MILITPIVLVLPVVFVVLAVPVLIPHPVPIVVADVVPLSLVPTTHPVT